MTAPRKTFTLQPNGVWTYEVTIMPTPTHTDAVPAVTLYVPRAAGPRALADSTALLCEQTREARLAVTFALIQGAVFPGDLRWASRSSIARSFSALLRPSERTACTCGLPTVPLKSASTSTAEQHLNRHGDNPT